MKQIDFLISTHYHVDHIGGMAELVKRIPIGHFIDHGPTVEEREQVQGFQAAYAELYGKAKHTRRQAGRQDPDHRPRLADRDVGRQRAEDAAARRRQAESRCARTFTPKEITDDRERQSVGSVITLGQFRAIDLGDLLWNKEQELMCPNNPIGTVDLFLVSHHGLDQSNSPALVHGAAAARGGHAERHAQRRRREAMQTMRTSPGLEDIWQLHWALRRRHRAEQRRRVHRERRRQRDDRRHPDGAAAAAAQAAARRSGAGGPPAGGPPRLARPRRRQPRRPSLRIPAAGTWHGRRVQPWCAAGCAGVCRTRGGGGAAAHTPAYMIKISAQPDGSFTVTNTRNGFTKTYAARPRATVGPATTPGV